MKNWIKKCLGVLMILILSQVSAMGLTIDDRWKSDDNTFTYTAGIVPIPKVDLNEVYGEDKLVPYTSHDGYGIVNDDKNYFDKIVTFDDTEFNLAWSFQFTVKNSTPFEWSDYHFEFWDATFTTRLSDKDLIDDKTWSSQKFKNSDWDGSILKFWAPNWVSPGDTDVYKFLFRPGEYLKDAGSIGIRQVATTIPEPATMALFGIGLLSLAGVSRRKKW